MTYKELVSDVAGRTGCRPSMVKDLLFHLSDVLAQMDVGDTVRTPLGVFRMTHSKGRVTTLPDGHTEAIIAAKTMVKLKSGLRLKRSKR